MSEESTEKYIPVSKVRALVMAEFAYWRDGDTKPEEDLPIELARIGAIGATSNILAALMGHPAERHPDKELWRLQK